MYNRQILINNIVFFIRNRELLYCFSTLTGNTKVLLVAVQKKE
jgi:hypothetical protein